MRQGSAADRRGRADGARGGARGRFEGAGGQRADHAWARRSSYLVDPAEGEAAAARGAAAGPGHRGPRHGAARLRQPLRHPRGHRGGTGRPPSAAREGVELAGRVGLSRNFGAYLVGNLVESLVRLGEWEEATPPRPRGGRHRPDRGVPGVGRGAAWATWPRSRGGCDEAEQHVRAARRQLGDNREPQFTQALLYIEADVARARGDLAAAAALVADGLSESTAWSARYSWPLIWLGARINADGAERARDRNGDAGAPSALRAGRPADRRDRDAVPGRGRLPRPAPRPSASADWAAGRRRVGGRRCAPGRRPADVWPLTYAQFRLAEALCAAGDRDDGDRAPARGRRPPASGSARGRCSTTSRPSPAARGSTSTSGGAGVRRRRRAGAVRAHRA